MKTYELSFIVSPEMTSEEAGAIAKEIESAVQNREGSILKQSSPVARTLSYPIAKRASGFFGILEFQLEPEKLVEIEEVVAKNKKIVRHMFLIKEPARIRKERRSKRILATSEAETKEVPSSIIEESKEETEEPIHVKKEVEKEKVELKDIEQQLDEILGE